MKKRIIFFSAPAYGHLMAEIPIIKKLVDLNYEVDFYCSKKYENFISQSGANFKEYINDFDSNDLVQFTANFYELFKNLTQINKDNYEYYVNKIDKNTDLIIYDSMCGFAKDIAIKLNIKHVCLSSLVAYNSLVFLFSNMFIPSVILYIKNMKKIVKLIKETNKFRNKNKLPKLNLLDSFVNKGDITIVFMLDKLQPFRWSFSKKFKFIGPIIKERPLFKDEKYNKKYDIYISFGSILTENKKVINEILNSDFFQNKKVIVNVGNMNIKSKNDNIELVKFTNQMELLKNCKLFINQGGLNSIYESISRGVVQISIPLQEEEKMNAIIINKKRIGYYMKKFDVKKIEKIEQNLHKYEKNLKKYTKEINGLNPISEAIKEIELILENK